jgi:hypothetical protein
MREGSGEMCWGASGEKDIYRRCWLSPGANSLHRRPVVYFEYSKADNVVYRSEWILLIHIIPRRETNQHHPAPPSYKRWETVLNSAATVWLLDQPIFRRISPCTTFIQTVELTEAITHCNHDGVELSVWLLDQPIFLKKILGVLFTCWLNLTLF